MAHRYARTNGYGKKMGGKCPVMLSQKQKHGLRMPVGQ